MADSKIIDCPLTRRNFLSSLAGAAVAASVSGGLLAGCSDVSPAGPPTGGSATLSLDDPAYAALKTEESVVKFPWKGEAPVMVRNIGGGAYEALSLLCPHQGCEAGMPNASKVIECGCHHSKFNISGNKISGPTTRGLYRGSVTVNGQVLTIVFP